MLSMLSICRANSRVALRHLSVGAHLAARRNAWGGKNSLRSNIMPPVSKHCSATRCASQRCPLDKLLMLAAKAQTSLAFARLHVTFAFSDGLPIAMNIHWHTSRALTRTIVISKKDLRFNVSERLRLRTAVEYDSNATMSTLIFYWAHEILRDCVPVVVLLSNRLPTIIPA